MNVDSDNSRLYTSGLVICPDFGQVKMDLDFIRLGPVNMKVLIVLLENHGQLISRAELFDKVWKNQVVNDDTLTRCISDIRSQLNELAPDLKLIETIPKRGYRWLNEVSIKPPLEESHTKAIETSIEVSNVNPSKINLDHLNQINQESKWKEIAIWSLASIVVFLLLSISVLWSINQFVGASTVRVALLPIQIESNQYDAIAAEFEEVLKAKLLLTPNIRFLSSRTLDGNSQNLYPYLSREFSAKWIIEGRIRDYKGKSYITLNLVDAKTAIVFDSISGDIHPNSENLTSLVDSFVALLSQTSN